MFLYAGVSIGRRYFFGQTRWMYDDMLAFSVKLMEVVTYYKCLSSYNPGLKPGVIGAFERLNVL
jgi:hypothetical protein